MCRERHIARLREGPGNGSGGACAVSRPARGPEGMACVEFVPAAYGRCVGAFRMGGEETFADFVVCVRASWRYGTNLHVLTNR